MKNGWYHFFALVIMSIWGGTFASTKVVLLAGVSPESIFFYRFLLAYIGVWFFGRNRLFAHNLKDEGYFMLLGITGGSAYFLTENYALQHTLTSNVALLVSTAPLFIALLCYLFLKSEKITKRLMQGMLIAFLGVSLVIFNGQFILKLNPAGDLLSILAACNWAVYSLLLMKVNKRYANVLIVRKTFFYGLLTILPVFYFHPLNRDFSVLLLPQVLGNLLFLGIVASLVCFFGWNMVVKKLGPVMSANYVYLNPIIALIISVLILQERITYFAVLGTLLILIGIIRSSQDRH
ncbi:MAG: DMT family transporter [Bacteroidales bacterium]|jgi:drug/metabolite transporter (DMT)-like permease|nr:DMT family transporter [Bacteroidales bacterium]